MNTLKLTIEQFEDMVQNADWTHQYDVSHTDDTDIYECNMDEGEVLVGISINGYVTKSSKANWLGAEVEISFTEVFSHTEYKPKSSIETSPPDGEDFEFSGFEVVDDDGDVIEIGDGADTALYNVLRGSEIDSIDYVELLGEDQVEEIKEDEGDTNEDMSEIIVRRDHNPDISAIAEVLACQQTSGNSGHSDYSGSAARWTELTLYITRGGKFICEKIEVTQWQGESNSYDGAVCTSHAEVIKFFGRCRLAKSLYREAQIQDVERVE